VRETVRRRLEAVQRRRALRVLDAGASARPWLGDLVTDVIDVVDDGGSRARVTIGDVNEQSTWNAFDDDVFDFVSCTHTLEDIRDPKTVVEQLSRVGKSGFISVPNRHTESWPVESPSWLGFGHHRWVFHVREPMVLEAVCKWPATVPRWTNRQRVARGLATGLQRMRRGTSRNRIVRTRPGWPNDWIDRTLARIDAELAILWLGDVTLSYVNSDFAGATLVDMLDTHHSFVSAPLARSPHTIDEALDLVCSVIDPDTPLPG
jgi:hypothetical protein